MPSPETSLCSNADAMFEGEAGSVSGNVAAETIAVMPTRSIAGNSFTPLILAERLRWKQAAPASATAVRFRGRRGRLRQGRLREPSAAPDYRFKTFISFGAKAAGSPSIVTVRGATQSVLRR